MLDFEVESGHDDVAWFGMCKFLTESFLDQGDGKNQHA
jgi:hypothetical protein